ncbi:MAG: hypothetical protein ACQESL_09170 [Bacteroidota bacterium]
MNPKSSLADDWIIDSQEDWQAHAAQIINLEITEGRVVPTATEATFLSSVKKFSKKRSVSSITISQSPEWLNWSPVSNIGPSSLDLGCAPVALQLGDGNYWMFGENFKSESQIEETFQSEDTTLEGFDMPLKTTPFPNEYNAPGGLKKGLGGYQAWQSRDMVNWVHHGPVTEKFSKWVTTAEYVDGKAYIYYDYPNDQDPHLYIDDDLTDGKPGKNMGMTFKDPSHGSDCGVIRDLEGNFHLILENWDPINASRHSWDSPLASHAVSPNGIDSWKLLDPAVDERTRPTGEVGEFRHPHWKQHPDWDSDIAKYNIHEPEQDAYGDWAAISIGGQYYLFGDFHPAGKSKMSVAWFTSNDINKQFTFCGNIGEGQGHPDPDIMFAEGKFYLVTQTETDYVSTGPWVETVKVRVGVDTTNDGVVNNWSEWQAVREQYDYMEGFAKQVERIPAKLDLSGLPEGYGFQFEVKITDTTENESKPILDKVVVNFDE